MEKDQTMTEFNDKDLAYVARRYRPDKYDTRRALRRFHAQTDTAGHRRWWMTAAAAAASVVLVFAAGYGIRNWVRGTQEPVQVEQPALNPNVADTHIFIYDNAPLDQVLAELSAYYHCTLKAPATDKHLTATFPDDDIEVIVSAIEKALNIEITRER